MVAPKAGGVRLVNRYQGHTEAPPHNERSRAKEARVLDYAMGNDAAFEDGAFDPGFFYKAEQPEPDFETFGRRRFMEPRQPQGQSVPDVTEPVEPKKEGVRLETSSDAIKFFADPKRDQAAKFIRLVAGTQQTYAPYDLKVVSSVPPSEPQYVFSVTGVVHVCPGKPTEVMQLSDWVHQASLFSAMRKIKLFKTYLISKAFARWLRNVRQFIFEATRAKLAKQLLLTKRVFGSCLARVTSLATQFQNVTAVSTMTRQDLHNHNEENNLGKFKDGQMVQRSAAAKELVTLIEQIELNALECCEAVRGRADVPDAGSMDVIRHYLKGQMEGEGTSSIITLDLKCHIAPRIARDIATRHNTSLQLPPSVPHLTIQGSLAACMDTKADLEEYLQVPSSTILKTRVKVRSMVQERASMLTRMSNMKRHMEEGARLVDFITLVRYIVTENLFKFTLLQAEHFKSALTNSNKGDEELLFLRLKMNYQMEEISFSPAQPIIQGVLGSAVKAMVDVVARECRFSHSQKFEVYLNPVAASLSPPASPQSASSPIHTLKNGRPPQDFFWLQPINVEHDARYSAVLNGIDEIVTTSFEAASTFGARFSYLHRHWLFLTQEYDGIHAKWEVAPEQVQPEYFKTTLVTLAAIRHDLGGIFNKCLGPLYVTMLSAKEEVMPLLAECERKTEVVMLLAWRMRVSVLIKDMQEAKKSISDTTTRLENFSSLSRAIRNLDSVIHTFSAREEESELLFECIERRGFRVSMEDRGLRDCLVGGVSLIESLRDLLTAAKDHRHNKVKEVISDIDEQLDTILRELAGIEDSLSGTFISSHETAPAAAMQFLTDCDRDVSEKERRLEELISCQDAVGAERMQYNFSTRELLQSRQEVWELCFRWSTSFKSVRTTQLSDVDVEAYKEEVTSTLDEITVLHEQQQLDVTRHLLERVEEEKVLLPLIFNLCNKEFKVEHWRPIFDALHRTFVEAATYTLECLLTWNVVKHADLVQHISDLATGQAGVERSLTDIEKEWEGNTIVTGFVQNHQVILNGQELLSLIDESSFKVEKLMNSEYLQTLHHSVKRWMELFATSRNTLISWNTLESGRIDLFAVTKTNILESKELVPIDHRLQDMLAEADSGKPALRILSDQKVISALTEATETYVYLRESVEQLLNAKRRANPRLITLSNAELLKALSSEPDLSVTFPHLKRVVRDQNNASTAVISADGETLVLSEPLQHSESQAFLGVIEGAIISSLKDQIKSALAFLEEKDNPQVKPVEAKEKEKEKEVKKAKHAKEKLPVETPVEVVPETPWVFKYVFQVCHVVDDIRWTAAIEKAITEHTLRDLALQCEEPLTEMRLLLTSDTLTDVQRISCGSLYINHLARKERIQTLKKAQVKSTSDFAWASYLRRYMEPKGHVVKHMMLVQPYGHEYFGCRRMFVQTPLTARAALVFAIALQAFKTPIVFGEHQTGRSAVVQDYAFATGKQILSVTCSPDMEAPTLVRAILGAAQGGSWLFFDDVHMLAKEAFLVSAHLIAAINHHCQIGKAVLAYGTTKTPLSPGLGFFLSSSRQHTDIPFCLKESLCPVCLSTPDFEGIAQTLLLCAGFEMYTVLGTRLAALLKLAKNTEMNRLEVFGLRILLDIIQTAASLQKRSVGVLADVVLANAVRQTVECCISAENMAQFLTLLERCFDSVPDVVAALSAKHIEATGYIIHASLTSAVNAISLILSRARSILVFGPALSGKSVAVECVAHVAKTRIRRMYAAAYSCTQLYGVVNSKTGTFEVGIIPTLIRGIETVTYLVFDAPLGNWVSCFLPALDSERFMRLVSNELVKLPDELTVVFECESISDISPSLVTRVAHVHFAEKSLHFAYILKRYLNGLENETIEPVIATVTAFINENLASKCRDALSLISLLKAFLENDTDGVLEDEGKFAMVLMYCTAWCYAAGNTATKHLESIHTKCADLWNAHYTYVATFPDNIFEVFPCTETCTFIRFDTPLVETCYLLTHPAPFANFCPLPHILSYTYLVGKFLALGMNVILEGGVDSGKSTIIQNIALRVQGEYLRVLPTTSGAEIVDALKGAEVTFFIDDVHLANQAGNVSPLETIRQLALQQSYFNTGGLVLENTTFCSFLLGKCPEKAGGGGGRCYDSFLTLALPDIDEAQCTQMLRHFLCPTVKRSPYVERIFPCTEQSIDIAVSVLFSSRTCLRYTPSVTPQFCFALSAVRQIAETFLTFIDSVSKPDELYRLMNYSLNRVFTDRCSLESDALWCSANISHVFEQKISKIFPHTEYCPVGIGVPVCGPANSEQVQLALKVNPSAHRYHGLRSSYLCIRVSVALSLPAVVILSGREGSGRSTVLETAAKFSKVSLLWARHEDITDGVKEAVVAAVCQKNRTVFAVNTTEFGYESSSERYEAVIGALSAMRALVEGNLPTALFTSEFTSELARVISKNSDERSQGVLQRVREACIANLGLAVLVTPQSAARVAGSLSGMFSAASFLHVAHDDDKRISQMSYEMLTQNPTPRDVIVAQELSELCAKAHCAVCIAADEHNLPCPSIRHLRVFAESLSSTQLSEALLKKQKIERAITLVKDIKKRKDEGEERLAALIPDLEDLCDMTDTKEKVVEKDTQSLTEVNVQLSHNKELLHQMVDSSRVLLKNITTSIESVKPQVSFALDAVQATTKKDIDELLSIRTPSPKIMLVMTSLLDVFSLPSGWDSAKRFLVDRPHGKLDAFDIEDNVDKILQHCKTAIDNPEFHPSNLRIVNPAAGAFCQWVRAAYRMAQQYQELEPTKLLLADANTEVHRLKEVVEALKGQAQHLELALIKSEEEYKTVKSAYLHAQDVRLKEEMMVGRASSFADAVIGKIDFWHEEAERMTKLGDGSLLFVHSACLAYLGPFNLQQREALIRKFESLMGLEETGLWVPETTSHTADVHENWVTSGLPADVHSHQSAFLVTHSWSVPALIDPHGVASFWMRSCYPGLTVCTISNLSSAVESLESGVPVLVEKVPATFPEDLIALISKASETGNTKLFVCSPSPVNSTLCCQVRFECLSGVESAFDTGLAFHNEPKLSLEICNKLSNLYSMTVKNSVTEDMLLDILYSSEEEPTTSTNVSGEVRSNAAASAQIVENIMRNEAELEELLTIREQQTTSPANAIRTFLYLAALYRSTQDPIYLYELPAFLDLINLGADTTKIVAPGLFRHDRMLFWIAMELPGGLLEERINQEEADYIDSVTRKTGIVCVDENLGGGFCLNDLREAVNTHCSEHWQKVLEHLLSGLSIKQLEDIGYNHVRNWLLSQEKLESYELLLFAACISENALSTVGDVIYPETHRLLASNFSVLDHSFCHVPVVVPQRAGTGEAILEIKKVAALNQRIESVVAVTAWEPLKQLQARLQTAVHLGQWFVLYDVASRPEVVAYFVNELCSSAAESCFRLFVVTDMKGLSLAFIAESARLVFDTPSDVVMCYRRAKLAVSSVATSHAPGKVPSAPSAARKLLVTKICVLHAALWGLRRVQKWDNAHVFVFSSLGAKMDDSFLDGVAKGLYGAASHCPFMLARIEAVVKDTISACLTSTASLETEEEVSSFLTTLAPTEPLNAIPLSDPDGEMVRRFEHEEVALRQLQCLPSVIKTQDMHPDCTAPLDSKSQIENPFAPILRREVGAYNELLETVETDIRSYAFEPSQTSALGRALAAHEVPLTWRLLNREFRAKENSPAHYLAGGTEIGERFLPLGSWLRDVKAKVEWITEWVNEGPPPSFWLPAFFFKDDLFSAMTFLSASTAQVYQLGSYKMSCTVTEFMDCDEVDKYPEVGSYIFGVSVCNGRWSQSAASIVPEPGVLSPLPVLLVVPTPSFDINRSQRADLPIYEWFSSCATHDCEYFTLPCSDSILASKRGTRLITNTHP